MSAVPLFATGLISLLALILVRRRIKRDVPMDKEERALLWVMAIAGGVSAIFAVLLWLGINPSLFMHYKTVIEIILIMGFLIFLVAIISYLLYRKWKWIILHFKKPIVTRINNRYRENLKKEIRPELETEVKTKKIVLTDQEKDEVLTILTNIVCSDIMDGQKLPPYEAHKVSNPTNSMKIDGIIFTVSQDDAEILVKKMTELLNNPKYRKRLYHYFGLSN